MDGFYALYYTGNSGNGNAVLAFRNGVIAGADSAGGLYDGKYSDENNKITVKMVLKFPAGTNLVTGQTLTNPLSQEIDADLPRDFANGQAVLIDTGLGQVNVVFKKLRGLS